MARSDLFIVSGPSGAGKGTIVKELLRRRPDVHVPVSYTTRPPRPMEKHGMHYYFVGEHQFKVMRERGEFIEWANVHGNLYGTPRRDVEAHLAAGRDVLLEIDVQGATQVKRHMPHAFLIFIEAPSMADLERRLRNRGTERPDAVARRLEDAYDELRRKRWFDGVVVNDDVDRAVEEVVQLMDKLKESRSP